MQYAQELNQKGMRLAEAGLFFEAINVFNEAIAIAPRNLDGYNNLAKTLNIVGDFERSLDVCRTMLDSAENSGVVYQNMAKTYAEMGNINMAVSLYYKAIETSPTPHLSMSDLLLNLNYTNATREMVYREHQKYSRFEKQNTSLSAPHRTDKERSLRIGYVSGDFCEHPVAHLIYPILKNHNLSKYKIYLYSNTQQKDLITERIKKLGHEWRDIVGISDTDAVDMIKKDRIDILVDLSGHTAGNRLLIFGGRAAPIQVSWLGYMNTTGLQNMDYRITDGLLMQAGAEKYYTEEICKVPNSFTFDPLHKQPFFEKPPALKNGFVTFGSLNNYKKVNDRVIDVWAGILKALPASKLILSAKGNDAFHKSILEKFSLRGINPRRVGIVGIKPLSGYIELLGSIDILLDPFPFSGCITVYHGLWSGVPSIVLDGDTEYGKNGAAVMSKAGLYEECVAQDLSAYIKKAINIATRPETLSAVRKKLRHMIENQGTEAVAVTHGLEEAYQQMVDPLRRPRGSV